jgi:hypothetical protein
VGGASNEATFSAEKIKISIHLTPMTTNPEMFLSFWLLIPVHLGIHFFQIGGGKANYP